MDENLLPSLRDSVYPDCNIQPQSRALPEAGQCHRPGAGQRMGSHLAGGTFPCSSISLKLSIAQLKASVNSPLLG